MKLGIPPILRKQYSADSNMLGAIALMSFFTAAAIILPFISQILECVPEVNDFSQHVMSNAAYNDFNISGRLKRYYLAFAAFAILFTAVFFLLNKVFKNSYNIANDNINVTKDVSVLGIIMVISGIFRIHLDIGIYFLATLLFLLCINIYSDKPWKTSNTAIWPILITFPLVVFVYKFLHHKYASAFQGSISVLEKGSLIFLALMLSASFFAYKIFDSYVKRDYSQQNSDSGSRIYYAFLPVMAIIPLHSLWLELTNVINVRLNIVINKPFLAMVIISAAMLLLSFIRFKNYKAKYTYSLKYYYLLMVLSTALMAFQPWKMIQPESEFFETANHGLSIDHFFRYGMLPIIETFDAHMLINQLPGYFYGFINGYEPWAPFLYNSYTNVIAVTVGFIVLVNLLGLKRAFLIYLCFPFTDLLFNHYILAGIAAITLLHLIRNPSNKNFYYFWLSLLILCLVRLDLGYASMLGAIITYFAAKIILRQHLNFKKFTISAIVIFGSALLFFSLICLIKGINPVNRIAEFLLVAMSNQNWAFVNVGDQSTMLFRILYYLLPLLVVSLIVIIAGRTIVQPKVYEQITGSRFKLAALIFFLFFSFTYLFNLQRGIVRHSLFFDMAGPITGTVIMALICFGLLRYGKRGFLIAILIPVVFAVTINMKGQVMPKWYISSMEMAVNSLPYNDAFHDSPQFNGTRVSVTFGTDEINTFKKITSLLLEPEETYFDFSSNNYYFALTGRKNPLYVNQSPLLLNGDKSQDIALEQIKKANPPMVLMPYGTNIWNSVDGIPTDFKYYKISEYIYENYVPLKSLHSCEVYVLKSKRNLYASRLKKLNSKLSNGNQEFSNFNDFTSQNIGKHNINTTIQDGKLVLKPEGDDPFIYDMAKYLEIKETLSANRPVQLIISAQAATEVPIQVFYLLQGQTQYTEDNSKRFTAGNTAADMVIDLTQPLVDFRIDIDGGSIIISSIKLKSQTQTDNAVTNTAQDYDLGNIPRLWAEFSDSSLFNDIKSLPEPIETATGSVTLPVLTERKGYLYIDMECDTIYNARIDLIDKNNNKKLGLKFLTRGGRHSYAIKLSSNKHWWVSDINKITFSADRAVKAYRFAIVTDSGKLVKSGFNEEFVLSDITDDNWFGGVGVKYNKLLISNSGKVLDLLKNSSHIQLVNGDRLTITGSNVIDNFIHIDVKEDLNLYREIAAYPNVIKFVK